MSSPFRSGPDAVPWQDSCWIAAGAFLAWFTCRREAWHGIDMAELLTRYVREGGGDHPYYTFFVPLLKAAHGVVALFGAGVFQAALLLSALGSAIGVLCTHLAARTLGMDRGSCAFAALLVATMPAVVYFAVIVEVHGIVLAASGVAWLLIARWARRPAVARAFAAGVGLAAAFLAHPVAGALGGVMWPLSQIVRPEVRWRQRLVGGGIASLPLLLVVGSWLLRRSSGPRPEEDALDRLTKFWHQDRFGLHASAVREWLVPFLPTSVLLLAGLFVRGWFRAVAAMWLATLPFVVAGWSVLVVGTWECGAYCAVVSGPSAIVVAAFCRPAWLRAGVVAAGLIGTAVVFDGLQPTREALATDAAVRAALGPRRALWVVGDGAGPDGQAWLTRHHWLPGVVLADILAAEPAVQAAGLRAIDRAIASHAAAGEPTIVTSTTVASLTAFAQGFGGAKTMLEWLSRRTGEVLAEADGVQVFAVRAP
ncbi:MAG: hypothetical protein WAT39_21035 [Planctomycetota bacterium]